VPFGFYGAGNIGDEATLHGFARVLAHTDTAMRVSVASQNPAHTARVEPAFSYFEASSIDPRRWLAKLRCSRHVFAGGTPIMDVLGEWPLCEVVPLVRSAEQWGGLLTFVGVGIENLRSHESRRLVADEIVPRVRHWSVRSERDRERLIEYGASPNVVTTAADMAWLIEPSTHDFGREQLSRWGVDSQQPLIGVNLVNENSVFDQHPHMVDALAAALDEMSQRIGAQVVFFANEVREDTTFDRAAAIRVISRLKHPTRAVLAPNKYFSPRQMMSLIGCCRITMSMRYHFCLFSALQEVPFLAIARTDKISDLCWDLGWRATVVPPKFSAEELVIQQMRLVEDTPSLIEQMKRTTDEMKRRAILNVCALRRLKLQ
jgi:polysaccharide pyruvyl transferase WcaK-like protein